MLNENWNPRLKVDLTKYLKPSIKAENNWQQIIHWVNSASFFCLWNVCIQIATSLDLIISLNESQFYSAILSLHRWMVKSLRCFLGTLYLKPDLWVLAVSSCTQNTALLGPTVWCACPVWTFEHASSALSFYKHLCGWALTAKVSGERK